MFASESVILLDGKKISIVDQARLEKISQLGDHSFTYTLFTLGGTEVRISYGIVAQVGNLLN